MQGLKFGLQFGILPFQPPDPLLPALNLAIKTLYDSQMFLVYLLAPPVLLQHPLGGHSVQIRTAVPIETFKIMGRVEGTRHSYLFSRFKISQLTLERAWISFQSLW